MGALVRYWYPTAPMIC
uniref:Uncharacterized protein n=1 Tax=Arundo donax TaxID=35708 RepID=A0A0A9H299_ARUDO